MKSHYKLISLCLLLAILILLLFNGYKYDTIRTINTSNPEEKAWRSQPELNSVAKASSISNEKLLDAGRLVNITGERSGWKSFEIRNPFTFPQPSFTRSSAKILLSPWVKELQRYLKSLQGTELSIVSASPEHTDLLLNWLIAASVKVDPPITNILALTLDYSLYITLTERNISSLFVHKYTVVSSSNKLISGLSQVHFARMAVLRLINHYGYTVINYDCDAIPIKNPQPLFDKYHMYDLIGGFSTSPYELSKKWHMTLNTGVMVMRGTPAMEILWQSMPHGKPQDDDQNTINFGLKYLGFKWTNYNSSEEFVKQSNDIIGSALVQVSEGRDQELRVVVLTFKQFCRVNCDPKERDSYYVWHAVASKNRAAPKKKIQALRGHVWYLRDNWRKVSDDNPRSMTLEWLRTISSSPEQDQ